MDSTLANICDECESFIDPTTWTPVESTVEDGEYTIYHFCDEECRQSWRSEDD